MWNCSKDDFIKEILSLENAPIIRDGVTFFESEKSVDEPPMYMPMKRWFQDKRGAVWAK